MAANERVDVVVVGAGISGLSAACVLASAGLTVRVLEARDRVGGRTLTVKDPCHGSVDLGGAYVGPTQNRVFRLAKELGLKFYHVNEKQKSVLSLKGVWKCFRGTVPPFWNPLAVLDLNHMVRSLDKMAEQVPVASPWTADCAKQWDTMTVKEFIDKTAWFSCTRELMAITVQSVLTSEPHEVSLLYWLWYIRSGQGLMRLTSITNGAQEKKIVGGSQQIAERLADSLTRGSVKLSSPVVLVAQAKDQVQITTDKGTVHTAGHVICAVPPPMLMKLRFRPALPGVRAQLLQRTPMGSIIKTNMFYDTPFWRQLGMCGSAISSEGPVGYTMDDTKHDGSNPAIMGFILADKSRELSQLSSSQRQKLLCEHYAKTFRCDKFLQPVGYLEKDWMEEEWSGGCYVSSLPPGVITSYARHLREPLGRVYFAGTETATEWAGYMDGAIQAGERAAREVLHSLGKLKANEIWQAEPESCDFPALPFHQSFVELVLPSVGSLLYFTLAVFIAAFALFYHLYR